MLLITVVGTATAQCSDIPTCESLGYNEQTSSCVGKALKCPFDVNKAFCGTQTCESLGYGQNKADCGDRKFVKCPFDDSKTFCGTLSYEGEICNVGSILYSDKICSTYPLEGKTPIGIVYDATQRKAISLSTTFGKNWQAYSGGATGASSTSNGRANSDIIYARSDIASFGAFNFCYTMSMSKFKRGTWYIPAIYELQAIYDKKSTLKSSLTRLLGEPKPIMGSNGSIMGAIPYLSGYFWSSTEDARYADVAEFSSSSWAPASTIKFCHDNGSCAISTLCVLDY